MHLPEYVRHQLGNAVCIAAITASAGSSQTLLTPLLHERGNDPATIGRLVAVASFVSLLMRIPGGLLYSPGRARAVMVGSLALAAVATLLHPYIAGIWPFAGVRFLYGVGYSVATTVNMALFVDSIHDDGDRRRSAGMYAGAMAAGYTLGGLTGGFAGQLLGFRLAYTVLAVLWLVAMLPVLFRPPLVARTAAAQRDSAAPPLGRVQWFAGLLLDPLLVSLVLGALFVNMLQSLFTTFTPLVLLAMGLGISQLGIMNAVFSMTNAVTRPFAGFVLDRIDHHRAQSWGIALNAAMLALFYLPLGFVPYLFVAVVAGTGRAVAVVANTVALTHDIDPARIRRGVASGILNAALDLGNIVGPIVGGLLTAAVGIHALWLLAPPLYLGTYYTSTLLLRRSQGGWRLPLAAPIPENP